MEDVCVHDVYRKCDGVLGGSVFSGMGRDSPGGSFAAFASFGHRFTFAGDHVYRVADQIYGISCAAADLCGSILSSAVNVRVEGEMVSGGRIWQLACVRRNLFGHFCRYDGGV